MLIVATGSLFLFGKVMSEAKYVSACAVVRDMVRTLIVVPRQGVMADPSGRIEELLQQSKADSTKKVGRSGVLSWCAVILPAALVY